MHNRQLIDIAIAAKRWRDTQRRRLAAVREKRLATEAVKALPALFTLLTPERDRQRMAEQALNDAKRDERQALKALARLCDKAAPVEDVMTVDEVRSLPRIEAAELV